MLNLLLVGAGNSPDSTQEAAIIQAHKIGAKVLAVDGNPNASGLKSADWREVVDIKNPQAVLEIALKYNREIGIDGAMVCGAAACKSVGRVVDKLGLLGVGEETARLMTQKDLRHWQLRVADINAPWFGTIRENMDWWWFPCVIKPISGSAAENVHYIKDEKEYMEKITPDMWDKYIIEEYIEGHELNTETIILTPQLYMTYISDRNYEFKEKYHPCMIENGSDMPSKIDDRLRNKVNTVIGKIIRQFKLERGILKCDLIIKENRVYVLECVPRLSGGRFCSHQVPMSTGVEIVNIAVRLALGLPVHPQELIPKKNIPTVQRYIFPEGPIKTHRDRGKDFICTGSTLNEAIENAQKAVKNAGL